MRKRGKPAKTDELRRSDYKFVFGTDEGQRVLADLSRYTRENGQTFVPGGTDAERWSIFLAGRRDVMLYVSTQIGEPQHERQDSSTADLDADDATDHAAV